MAMGPLTIGRPTEAKINSTSNDRTTKGGTRFTYENAAASYCAIV